MSNYSDKNQENQDINVFIKHLKEGVFDDYGVRFSRAKTIKELYDERPDTAIPHEKMWREASDRNGGTRLELTLQIPADAGMIVHADNGFNVFDIEEMDEVRHQVDMGYSFIDTYCYHDRLGNLLFVRLHMEKDEFNKSWVAPFYKNSDGVMTIGEPDFNAIGCADGKPLYGL